MSFSNVREYWEHPTEIYDHKESHAPDVAMSSINNNQFADENLWSNNEIQSDHTSDDVNEDSNSNSASRKKQNRRLKYPLLPPCRICGDKSSGFHYGATTCEACKGFFRRTLYRKKEFVCFKGTYDCDVLAPKKAPCPGCRYRKCVEAGMSKDGVKRGRYSLTRKTHHIMEVKGLQSTDLSPAPSKLPPQTLSPPIPTPVQDNHFSDSSSMSHSPNYSGNISGNSSGNFQTDLTRIIAHEEFLERKSLADILHQSYHKYCRYPEDVLCNLPKIQQEYANLKHVHHEFFGPWDLVDQKTFLELYKTTGIDVDYRITYFRDRFLTIEQSIYNLVDFAKSIPGFRSVELQDQITLIKSVQFHWWFLCAYPGISNETGTYTASTGDCMYRNEMQRFTGEAYADMIFHMSHIFHSLDLDDTERALVIALCVFSSDFAIQDVQNFAPIDNLHQQIGETLYFYTKSHKTSNRFGRIISALVSLRSGEAIHIEGRNKAWKIFEETQFAIDVPPLMMELWAGMIPAFNPEQICQAMSGQLRKQSLLAKRLMEEMDQS